MGDSDFQILKLTLMSVAGKNNSQERKGTVLINLCPFLKLITQQLDNTKAFLTAFASSPFLNDFPKAIA
jgi:hypothetical protein